MLEFAIRSLRVIGLLLSTMYSASLTRAESVFFMADGNTSTLWSIDPITGDAAAVGSLGIDASFIGMAYDVVSDTLYLTSTTNSVTGLYVVNQSTGAASLVGATGVLNITGLAFDPVGGVLYGGSGATDALYTVDQNTGVATEVGGFGVNVGGHGLGYDPAGQTLFMTDFNTDTLYELDGGTGTATTIGATFETQVVALAFNTTDNQLYGIDAEDDELIRLNQTTGISETVGSLGIDAFNIGMAYRPAAIPEPGTCVFLAGLCCCVGVRRRR